MKESQGSAKQIDSMEEAITSGINKFETAMEHLAEKVEEGGEKLQHIVDLGKRQRDQVAKLKDKSQDIIEPVRKVVERAQSNPRPYLVAAAGVLCGVLAIGYFLRKSGSSIPSLTSERPEKPETSDATGNFDHYDTNEYVG
jgi:hypothetical protein